MNNENGDREFDPFAQDQDKGEPRKPGGGVAWLALLLALLAAAATGYQWWTSRQADPEDEGRQAMLQSLQRTQAGLEQSVQALEDRVAAAEQSDETGRIGALESQMDSLQGRVAELGLRASDGQASSDALQTSLLSLDQRLAAVETSVAALAVRGDSPGKRMDLSEVEYLLRLASERLQLFADPLSSDQALALADERLESLEDPLYLPVRQRIAASRQALQALPVPDALQLSGRIGALQAAVPTLPFPGEVPADAEMEPPGEEGLWARFKRVMSGLVTVRRRVPEDDVVMSLEDQDYVRQGLWLQLESARLALMRADAVAYGTSLQRSADTLATMFEARSERVARAAAEIADLQRVEIAAEMPDISAPWAQLRLLREGRVEAMEEPQAPDTAAEETSADAPAPDEAVTDDEEGGDGPG